MIMDIIWGICVCMIYKILLYMFYLFKVLKCVNIIFFMEIVVFFFGVFLNIYIYILGVFSFLFLYSL